MPSPPIQLFLTTIASQPQLRSRQDYLLRILQAKKITYNAYDLASDEKAKLLWKRKGPQDKSLPGILVGGDCPGPFSAFEEAVEYGELDTFLRLKEEWHDDADVKILPQQHIAVPGAHTPLQMTPEAQRVKILAANASADASPSRGTKQIPVNKLKEEEQIDLGDEFSGYGLQGVKVTNDELAALVAELGLDGDDAGDLVRGLAGDEQDILTSPHVEPSADIPDIPDIPDEEIPAEEPSEVSTAKDTVQDSQVDEPPATNASPDSESRKETTKESSSPPLDEPSTSPTSPSKSVETGIPNSDISGSVTAGASTTKDEQVSKADE
ncbi:hypothetical protein DL96DRAFT_1702836 [Flagelloscypha sp. PMI_526]|nr:hypothetical protein DL96DRAFT_1702836 [Flagelloscypha sp. PMI_526]